jgi:hypothetical protein
LTPAALVFRFALYKPPIKCNAAYNCSDEQERMRLSRFITEGASEGATRSRLLHRPCSLLSVLNGRQVFSPPKVPHGLSGVLSGSAPTVRARTALSRASPQSVPLERGEVDGHVTRDHDRLIEGQSGWRWPR